jgi:hypothetical protein
MVKSLLALFIILAGAALCLAQQRVSADDQPAPRHDEFLLNQLAGQVKDVDEPALRIFLRIQIATFLWSDGAKSIAGAAATAEEITLAALADLKDNDQVIPESYARLCRRDAMALLKLHSPKLYAKAEEQQDHKEANARNPISTAYALLDSKDGVAPAVRMATQALRAGVDTGGTFFFFLHRLEKDHPKELIQVLREVLPVEERQPGTIDFYNFSSMKIYYLSEAVPPDLKARFLTAIVRAIESGRAGSDQSDLSYAHEQLRYLYPTIETLAPSLIERVNRLTAALRGQLTQATLEQIDIQQRVQQSTDPLNQLILEANSTKDKYTRTTLLRQAEHIAFDKGQLKLAADLEVEASGDENKTPWRDQFLGDIVSQAIKQKDIELADYATSKIIDPLKRAECKQKIALYYLEAKDTVRARETLNEAAALILSSENNLEKAKALLVASTVFMKIDELRVFEMAQAAIKVINTYPRLSQQDTPGSKAHNEYVESLAQAAWLIVPIFSSLAEKDELGTISLAKGIQLHSLRASALFGACKGTILASERKKTVSVK